MNIRKILTICFLSIGFSALYAQPGSPEREHKWAVPNYDSIARAVSDPGSTSYYPELMRRYELGDTSLTLNDFRNLYYGFPAQPNYKPLLPSPYTDSLTRAFGRKTNPTPMQYREMQQFAVKALRDNPFSLRDLNALSFLCQMLGENELAERQLYKMSRLVETIQSTGMGVEEESPWYIINMQDAEDVLKLLKARFTRLIIITRTVAYAPVSNMPTKKLKGFYFNYSEIYKRRPDYLDDVKVKRKLQVNPLYNPNSPINVLPK